MSLGRVIRVVNELEVEVYSIELKKEIIVAASKEYVSSVKVELEEVEENIIVEYDLDTKKINENIEI